MHPALHASLVAAATRADNTAGGGLAQGLLLGRDEHELWRRPATLIEPRRQPGQYQGTSNGMRIPLFSGMSWYTGRSRGTWVPGPELQVPIDEGQIVLTEARAVFVGDKATRQWAWSKLLGLQLSAAGDAALIHVTNRQKPSGIHTPGAGPDELGAFLTLTLTIFQQGAHHALSLLTQNAPSYVQQPSPPAPGAPPAGASSRVRPVLQLKRPHP